MPNYVENVIRLKSNEQKIREMLEAVKNDKRGLGTIDFNKIIPIPESLNIECGTRTDRGLKAYRDFVSVYTLEGGITGFDLLNIPEKSEREFLHMRSDVKPDEWELGKQAFHNQQKYGATTWYEWSIGNWGTKWNAGGYDESVDYSRNDELRFKTAWSAPHPVMKKLSEMYPEITFEHEWADEDIGVNCGRRVYKNGNIISEYIPESTKESMELAASVWQYDLRDMNFLLNKAETAYISTEADIYELIELFGKPMLFADERLSDADIPTELYCYHLRESDDGDRFCTIEPKVGVNHGGSVITDEPIDFGGKGYIPLTYDTCPNFIGEKLTIDQYMCGEFSMDSSQEQTQGEIKL